MAEAVKKAESAFGLIDVLVNHAGYGYLVALEEGEDEEVRALFDTNVFGVVDVTRAVLPGMRARRAGHVVNISSLGGLAAFGATGYHHATKFAVEGLSESLAAEVAPLGIKVTIVGPPAFRTNWSGPSTRQSAVTLDDYTESAGTRRTSTLATHGHQPGDPARASEAIIGAVEAEEPPLRLLLGKAAYDIVRPGWTPPGPASPPGAMSPSEPTTPWPRPRVCHQRERPAPDAWHGSSLRCRVTRVRPVRGRRSALRSTAPDSPSHRWEVPPARGRAPLRRQTPAPPITPWPRAGPADSPGPSAPPHPAAPPARRSPPGPESPWSGGPTATRTGQGVARRPLPVGGEDRRLALRLRQDLVVGVMGGHPERFVMRGQGRPQGRAGRAAATGEGRHPAEEAHERGERPGDDQIRQHITHGPRLREAVRRRGDPMRDGSAARGRRSPRTR